MWKKTTLISFGLWVLTLAGLAYFFHFGVTVEPQSPDDDRINIQLQPEEREIVLREMRLLLESTHGVLDTLQEGDRTRLERFATNAGMKAAADISPPLMLKLPKEFKRLGIQVHKDFDTLAKNAKTWSSEEIQRHLTQILGKCVGCHASFRLAPVSLAKAQLTD